MITIIFLGLTVFALAAAGVAICHIRRRKRVRKVQKRIYQAYLREEAILRQNYFATYFAMLQTAEEQKKKAQNPPMSKH